VSGALGAALLVLAHADGPNEARARALCERLASWTPTAAATPTDADRTLYAGKTAGNCWAFLYTEPADRDVQAARRCCLVSGDCNRELAVLFANGWGVPRDYDAATHFLCRAGREMAPFEQWAMLDRVQEMREEDAPKDLDYCHHVTSGRGALLCEQLGAEREAPEIEARIEKAAGAPAAGPARDALTRLVDAAEAFARDEAGHRQEGARGGTGYAAFVMETQRAVFATFVAALERYARGRAPAATAAALTKVDRDLNAAYRKALETAREPCPLCNEDDHESGPQALREAQRAWIAYRDAWTAWYRLRWTAAAAPAALEREIAAALTAARAKELAQPE
jgi:uncharacterized protein YecT (DUF1311 family)